MFTTNLFLFTEKTFPLTCSSTFLHDSSLIRLSHPVWR